MSREQGRVADIQSHPGLVTDSRIGRLDLVGVKRCGTRIENALKVPEENKGEIYRCRLRNRGNNAQFKLSPGLTVQQVVAAASASGHPLSSDPDGPVRARLGRDVGLCPLRILCTGHCPRLLDRRGDSTIS